MSTYTMILLLICLGILFISFIYTLLLMKEQKSIKGNMDGQISEQVQDHPYIRNPIFVAYAIFFALLILTIVFVSLTFHY
ncbi:hypothetical protein ACE38V_02755 [Cytobacillus sp. Hz8]|uniref:hypothetical protein n=1 Tax=Cytobacillus sp. Hz8 TaxID=3347168 RepID=UPI0035D564D0